MINTDRTYTNKKGELCFYKYKSGKLVKGEKAVKAICSYCGKDCWVRPRLMYQNKFCDVTCQRNHIGFRMKGEKHRNWKGGKRLHSGYYVVMTNNHPFGSRDGYVLEHRLIMEKHLGRILSRKEKVHHINGNKIDNRIENLYLCDNKTHKDIHYQLEKLAMKLYNDGLIKFKDGEYFI